MTLDSLTDLSLTVDLKAPRSKVWECWTRAEHLKAFFIPAPHSIESCEIDLKVGGKFNTVFLIEGNQVPSQGVFLEIIPGERLVFTDTYSAGWKPAAEPFMTAIVELSDTSSGGCHFHLVARHRSEESRKAHEDMGFFDGWTQVAKQLEALALTL